MSCIYNWQSFCVKRELEDIGARNITILLAALTTVRSGSVLY